jgi:hypothetical protein
LRERQVEIAQLVPIGHRCEVGGIEPDGVHGPASQVRVDHVDEAPQVLVEECSVVDDGEVTTATVDVLCVP